jgi:hypothetical protein
VLPEDNTLSFLTTERALPVSATVWIELVAGMHSSGRQMVIAVTGGGSKAISQLLEVPGGSRTLLEAIVPYSQAAMTDWLGGQIDQACSEPTARAMAMAAWLRARRLAPEADPQQLVGVGSTASLASDRPKRGEHRMHVAVQTAMATASFSLQLAKGARDRKKEEWLAAKLVLTVLGEVAGVDANAARQALLDQLHDDEPVHQRRQEAPGPWTELLLGRLAYVGEPTLPHAILPGAFNPPHVGHQRLAQVAAQRLGQPVAYELSITNVDKRPLDFLEIAVRLNALRQLDDRATVVLTDAPTFRQKSALFPGCTFVVGADTVLRISDPRYYDGQPSDCAAALAEIADRGCRFLVFGRQIDNHFRVLSELKIPDSLRALCDEVPAGEFREDVSSTELRVR